MTRDQALGLYRPIRASIRRILPAAIRMCSQPDLMFGFAGIALRLSSAAVIWKFSDTIGLTPETPPQIIVRTKCDEDE
jgi:hypothetical protein